MSDKYFTILHFDGVVTYADKSKSLKEYDTPAASLELTTADTLYIGHDKPFNSFYMGLETLSVSGSTTTAEYYNGTAWTSLEICDESLGFSRSGFITFSKPDDMASVDVDGKDKFYIRLKVDVDTGALTSKLFDIMFSNDLDLAKIRENIVTKFALTGSWLTKHIAARDHIIQEFRNSGNVKTIKINEGLVSEETLLKDITKFDFLEPTQLRIASAYFAMYLIFWFELSDEENDKWQLKAMEMKRLYENAMELFFTAIDLNDDGLQNEDDKNIPSGAIHTIVTG